MSSITSLELAHLLINNIISKHGLPSRIVSDRGSLYASSSWTNLCQQLKISRDLSTAYHPEADGQTERVNQILEQYLWRYVSYHQDDWDTFFPLAEFAYNNSDHSSTKKSPFFTVYGRDPQFDSVHITQDNPAGKVSTKIQSVQQDVKRELEISINRFKRYAGKSRASPPFSILVTWYGFLPRNSNQLDPPKTLSERWLVKTSTIPNQHKEPSPPVIIGEDKEGKVSQILYSKTKRGKLWYMVEWKGFSKYPKRSTWEPTKNLKNCAELVKDVHSLYPDTPEQNPSRA
ncbi:hypothetical protein O181_006135 [Austropuccinia psidii MF-1]|uniref:Integrase catalytic domain-containing protein n=1 Tax=Austropuccinia psidii MF-1 TaxID=1389203 RepID=A0A9Q3GGJ1_9BASI|nr:hypothetical protein [Austropuccinia psidii MF-1]